LLDQGHLEVRTTGCIEPVVSEAAGVINFIDKIKEGKDVAVNRFILSMEDKRQWEL
jgi:hypothetical protein